MIASWKTRALAGYYLAAPLFLAIDLLFDAPIRAAAIPDRSLRYGYYALTLLCGLVAYLRPRAAPLVGMSECSINLLLLVLGVMMPIFEAPARAAAGEALEVGMSTSMLVNFLLSGAVLAISFRWHERELRS